jgi:hypothetical protein
VAFPDRDAFTRSERRLLKQGAADKADLWVAESPSGRVVVKDFAAKGPVVRWLGRRQIARELAAYRWLGDQQGIPRLLGAVDTHAIAIEWIPDAVQLGYPPAEDLRRERGPDLYGQLRSVVDRIHESGLVHWDLRTRDNVVVGENGKLYVLDFASAFRLRPGSIAYKALFRRMRQIDISALLKWRQLLHAGPLSEEEEAFLRRYRFWRSLWVFNRKPPGRRSAGDRS